MGRRSGVAVSAALLLLPALVLLVATDAYGQTPKRGGVLRIADREAPNLDPHLAVSFLTHSWSSMVYSQLVRFAYGPEQKHSADFTVVPDLAEKWKYESPTSVVFTLRKASSSTTSRRSTDAR
jgi:ABC-type transport system substrate-binding protein